MIKSFKRHFSSQLTPSIPVFQLLFTLVDPSISDIFFDLFADCRTICSFQESFLSSRQMECLANNSKSLLFYGIVTLQMYLAASLWICIAFSNILFESAWQTFSRREMKAVEPNYSVSVSFYFIAKRKLKKWRNLGAGGETAVKIGAITFFSTKFAHWIFNFFFIQTFSSLSVCWKFSSSLAHLKNNRRQGNCAFRDSSGSGARWVLVREYWSRSVLGIL